MSNTQASSLPATKTGRGWHITLWTIQILLAVLYAMSGVMNTFMPPSQLISMGMSHAAVLPYALLRFLGIAELAGVVGLLLPAFSRIKPGLTPLAALGFVVLQVLAMGYHITHGEFFMLPVNLVLLALAALVWWGRTKKSPIASR
ncbi:DoxX family protein [Burkholderia multivorans]|uniref:DoxX family protein n=1 Tax=Burkholderia multivorans TaxID=87883 RepID=UPI001C227310|nr:DoxX family protein [Burkholderia multivorans]MBU9610623.1 DoxX family protein [Burkholderia multivorans]